MSQVITIRDQDMPGLRVTATLAAQRGERAWLGLLADGTRVWVTSKSPSTLYRDHPQFVQARVFTKQQTDQALAAWFSGLRAVTTKVTAIVNHKPKPFRATNQAALTLSVTR